MYETTILSTRQYITYKPINTNITMTQVTLKP